MSMPDKNVGFNKVYNVICKLISNEQEFCRFNVLNNREANTHGIIICDFSRHGNTWVVKDRNLFTR